MKLVASRKVNYTVIILAVLLLSAVTYYFTVYNSVNKTIIETHAFYKVFDSEETMFNQADAVIIGSTNQNFDDRKHVTTTFASTGATQDFYTITNVQVDKILKGDVLINQTLQVGEPISYDQTLTGKSIITREGYKELKAGSKYLLFLKKNRQGLYFVMTAELGKYNVDNSDP
ncbi:hypothetical protein ACFPYJ_12825 [Paenibacillus solisilvae]|uniref:DUF5590 domain-containing protein n=1 Tax=Paenibacillus solisilvae TaxID=2486751 RepID=A0ABW0VVY3_9BACL